MSNPPTVGEGWIEWAGGENPVGSADVAYRVSDDLEDVRYGFADQLDWRRIPAHPKAPIIAYRVVSAPLEGPEALGSSSLCEDTHRAADGLVVVPREPTKAMVAAADCAGMAFAGSDLSGAEMTAAIWSAMIAAGEGEWHERNLTASNADLLAQALSHPTLSGHDRHLVEVDFPNGMRLTIVREDDYDAVAIWSEDCESIFTQADVPHLAALSATQQPVSEGEK